jgi:hypothetical protein
MYEMEGPRQRPAALASRLLGRHVPRDACLAALANRLLGRRVLLGGCLAALANRLLRCRVLRGATGVRFPTSAPVSRPFHRSLGFPWGGSRLRR